MRRVRFVLLSMAILISACSQQISVDQDSPAQGEISVSLTSEDSHRIVLPLKSSSTVDTPDPNAFEVEIFNSNGIRLYRKLYSETVGQTIYLNAGDYRLLTHYGDSLGVGFDVTYFESDQNFTVRPQTSESVQAVAKMANVMVTVKYGENLKKYYPEHYARVKHPELAEYLEFSKDETRNGYIPAADLVLEVYAMVDGVLKCYTAEPLTCAKNDHVTFNIDALPLQEDITVNITIDNSVEVREINTEIPASAATVPAPEFSAEGFDQNNSFVFIEAEDYENVQTNIVAMGGISTCTLNITSDYLTTTLGLPAQVDLVNADASVKANFEAVGISWSRGMSGARLGAVNFTGVSKKIAYSASNTLNATFEVVVTDKNGKSNSASYTISQTPAKFSLNATSVNAFAKRIEGLSANVTSGKLSLVALQYSTDQSTWTTVPTTSVNGSTLNFDSITGLTPSTACHLRLIYNGNEDNVATAVLSTEAAAQIGNSGFEDWYEWEYKVYGTRYHTSYGPYFNGGDKYWDTNNSVTAISTTTPSNYTYKSFPSVTYVTGRTGSKAAQMITIAVSATGSSVAAPSPTVAAGRLFTGVYGGSEDIAFTSRPSKMAFYYKLSPYDSDSFKAYIYLKNGDTIIGEATLTSNTAASDWTRAELDINYSRTDLKAQTVHVEFVSGVNASWGTNRTISYGGTNTASTHSGNVLTIDDLELIYE